MGEQEVSQEYQRTKLLRESAIVLAAATGLLYLAGHIYTGSYLEALGIEAGFHIIGLSNLALIHPLAMFAFLLFVGVIYYAMSSPGIFLIVAGGFIVFTMSSLKELLELANGMEPDIALASIGGGGITIVFWCLCRLRKRVPSGNFVEEEIADIIRERDNLLKETHTLDKELENAIQGLSLHASQMNGGKEPAIDSQEVGGNAVMTDAERLDEQARLKSIQAQNRERTARLSQPLGIIVVLRYARILRILAAGYIAVFSILPGLALMQVRTALGGSWLKSNDLPDTAERVPVYWIGDRYIYVTNARYCEVHAQILGVEQARRVCPPLLAKMADNALRMSDDVLANVETAEHKMLEEVEALLSQLRSTKGAQGIHDQELVKRIEKIDKIASDLQRAVQGISETVQRSTKTSDTDKKLRERTDTLLDEIRTLKDQLSTPRSSTAAPTSTAGAPPRR